MRVLGICLLFALLCATACAKKVSIKEPTTEAMRQYRRARFKELTAVTGNQPYAVHIALAGNDNGISTGMTVSWITAGATASSSVLFGPASGVYSFNATGDQTTYFDSYSHHVVLQNLQPSTRYFYICGDSAGGFSTEYNFETAPAAPRQSVFNIYGDMGATYSEGTVAQLFNQIGDVDLVWHVGDMSYADDDIDGYDYEKVWDFWMNTISNISAYKPYMVLPGNHEAECHFIGCLPLSKTFYKLNNFTAYRHRYRMPYEESNGPDNMWYSFNYGPVHFVSIDTETNYPNSPEGQGSLDNYGPAANQLAWLEADLAAAAKNRAAQPWILVGGHRPVYSTACVDSSTGKPTGSCAHLQSAVEDLFNKYQINAYFAGHVHAYERSKPVYQGTPTANAPVYIVHGAAGNVEGHQQLSATAPWLVARDTTNYGYGRLTVFNSTTLHWAFYTATNNALADEMYLTNPFAAEADTPIAIV